MCFFVTQQWWSAWLRNIERALSLSEAHEYRELDPVCSASQEEALLQQMQTRQRALRLASMCYKVERQLGIAGKSQLEESKVQRALEEGSGHQWVEGHAQYAEPAELSLTSNASDALPELSSGWGSLGGEEVSARLANLELRKKKVICCITYIHSWVNVFIFVVDHA
jgi:hypothetical protein